MAAITIFLLVLISYSSLSNGSQNADIEAEIQALTSIKSNLHDPLQALTNWNSSSPSAPCDWHGITCTSNRVTELRLPRMQLTGTLSPQISNLRMLQKLSLRSNSFNSTIPLSLFQCTLLKSIFLQYNSFSGGIPVEISNLTNLLIFNVAGNLLSGEIPGELPVNLRVFDISSNRFDGEVPMNISSGSRLELVNFSYNNISGEIPVSIGALQNLQYLWLDYNNIYGTLPSAIANCSKLIHLSAEGNNIGGVLPVEIGALPNLQVIALSSNNFSGSVPGYLFCNVSDSAPSIRIVQLGFNGFTEINMPDSRSCFSVIKVLDLQHNQITGAFPQFLTNLSTLTAIDFSGNVMSGPIPSGIGNLLKLEELKLVNNSFEGLVPVEIQKCRSLRVLDLEGNALTGEIPPFLGEIRNMRVLSLGMNNFSGSIPVTFGSLSSLEMLSIGGNRLTGLLPDELMVLGNLTTLDLSGNMFHGAIPSSIGNLKQLTVLNLSDNGFTDTVPESIGRMFKLKILDLSKQNLSGILPTELLGLPNLEVIALQENRLSGEVPEGLSSLLGLRYLNLSSNSFSGIISPTFGFLKSLVVLSLSSNHISGSVPQELGYCSSLEVLNLRSNSLSGQIPANFSYLSQLKVLDLGINNLDGQIPESLSNCSSLTILSLDSNRLNGEIPSNLTLVNSLVDFNVSKNNLEGEIPVVLASRFNSQSSFTGNKGLCGKPLDRNCEEVGNRKNRVILIIAVVASGSLFMLSCCCFYAYSFLQWREKMKSVDEEKKPSPARVSIKTSGSRASSESGVPKLIMFNNKITLAETIEATRNFDEENVLSRTQQGVVYKACYNDGMVLAIRRLPSGSSLDTNTFRKEAESLGIVKHRNLTVVRGYYAGPPGVRLLVYDYMPNGNLATLLQEASHQDGHVLNWPMRHLIALGIARGLAFLHATSLVHGDVRPQNVMFDADFEAHLSDFGLDRLSNIHQSETSTSALVGYTSPEFTLTNKVSKESDVYSFGIVLLELLTGKRPVMFTQDEDIVKWVKKQLQRGQITELLEPGLLELDPESSEWEEFLLGIKVGLLSTTVDPSDRPTMADIVFMLEGCRVGPDIGSSADPTTMPSPS